MAETEKESQAKHTKQVRKDAGLDDPKRGESYTSPGGFIKIPTTDKEPAPDPSPKEQSKKLTTKKGE